MADRYWVGGTGTWNTTSTTNWSASSGGASGASRPAATDNVIFDQAATYTVTMTGALTCLDITVSAGTVTFATGTTPTLTVSGSMSLRAGTVWTNTGLITFRANANKTIATNGVTLNAAFITINQLSTTVSLTLSTALTTVNTCTITLTQGTLDLNGFTCTTGIFSSTNTNTRLLAFGTGSMSLSHPTAATVVLSMATATFFNCTGTGGFTVPAMSVTRTFTFGTTGTGWSNAPNLTFTTGASVATITTLSSFNNLNFGTTSFNPGAITVNIAGLTLSGSGTYTTLTVIAGATGTVPRLADGTIITNAKTILALTLNHTNTAGTTTLGSDVTTGVGVTGITTLTLGTLALAGNFLTTGIFSSSGTGTRALVTGAGFIVLSASSAGTTVLSMATATGFTYARSSGGFSAVMSNSRTFTFGTTGGTSANAPNLTLSSGASVATITSGSYFNTLSYGTTTFIHAATTLNVNSLTLSSGGTYTALSVAMRGTGTITNNGKAIAAFTVNTDGTTTLSAALSCTTYTQTAGAINFATFNLTCSSTVTISSGQYSNTGTITCTTWIVAGSYVLTQGTITPSTGFTLTSGTFDYNGGTLSAVPTFTHTAGTFTLGKDYALTTTGTYTHTAGTIALAGFTLSTGIFISSNSNTRAITFGTGNINLTHTTAATMVMSMDTLTNFTYTGTGGFTVADMSNTRTFNVGTTGGTTSNVPNLTFTTGASVATIVTGSKFNTLNFGTTSFDPGAIALTLSGLTLSSGGTYTSLSATMVTTGTITNNGKSLAALTLNASFSQVTLTGALTLSGAFTLTAGTLVCGVYNFQSATFASTGSSTRSMTGSGTYTITGSGATAFSNGSGTGITIVGLIISMTSASAKTFAGQNGNYSTLNQGGAGALTITGNNTFGDITATTRPSTITLGTVVSSIGQTQTCTAFTLSGTAGNLVTINSQTPGVQSNLSKSSGTISVDYLSIQDCLATGGATWYAGANSTNVSNNTGWIFTAPTAAATGNFFLFFN